MLKYFKSREFFITLAAVIGFSVLVYVVFFFVFLPYYTNHGEEAAVPDVSKLQLDEAIVKLEEAGLRYEIADSLFLSTLPSLSIISQDPIGGSKVKPGRRVYLTVNKVVAPVVKFPDINGVSQYQAKLRLEGSGLVLGEIKFIAHEFADLVLSASFKSKNIKEGEEIRKGSKIDLVVGKGRGDQKVEIPDLVGNSYESANATLLRLGLSLGNLTYDPSSEKTLYTILRQHPDYAEGDSIHVGQEMDLWIAGPEPGDVIEGGDGSISGGKSGDEGPDGGE
ncbi:MAG: PASTA domain-containing protein [Bacteroidetes bacterium]|nr:PASTA domain-containing protein [Bacteroidota bacterium]MBL0017382.1 PASTA domain-containing protein [Bacteroidota bacterium]